MGYWPGFHFWMRQSFLMQGCPSHSGTPGIAGHCLLNASGAPPCPPIVTLQYRLCPSGKNVYAKALTPSVIVFGGGAFGTLLGLDEVKRVKFHDGINVLRRIRETTGNSLVIRPSTSTVGGTGLPLVGRTKIPHATRHSQNQKKEERPECEISLFLCLSQSCVDTVRRQLSANQKVQFSSVAQSCPTLCDPMDCSMPGLPVHHQLLEFAQIHVHRIGDAIQPSHPLSSPSPPAFNLSQHQGLFQ